MLQAHCHLSGARFVSELAASKLPTNNAKLANRSMTNTEIGVMRPRRHMNAAWGIDLSQKKQEDDQRRNAVICLRRTEIATLLLRRSHYVMMVCLHEPQV